MQLSTEILQSLYAAINVSSLPKAIPEDNPGNAIGDALPQGKSQDFTTLETKEWNKVSAKELKDQRGRRKMCSQTFKLRPSLIW